MKIDSEISGLKNEGQKEQQVSEELSAKLSKCVTNYESQMSKQQALEARKKWLNEEFHMLKQSLRMTEEEKDAMDKVKNEVEEKQNTLEKAIMDLHASTKAIRDDIINHASQQKTIEKSSANLLKQTKQSYENISKKEVAIEGLVNEISRVKIDNLNARAQNEILQKKLGELVEELKGKEKEVASAEGGIKTKHTEISKKQLKVDQLNKQWSELAKNGDGEENRGPLENMKKGIEDKIKQNEDDCLQVQKNWISNQTDLIAFQDEKTKIEGNTNELQTKEMILQKKKLRLNQQVESHKKRIKDLEIAHKNLSFEMNKLNDLIYRHKSATVNLTDANYNIENQFKQKLKELENESIKLENQITQLKEQKADILGEIVEAERQILLWERKITLEKEMQETLDPTIGQKEIVAMKKEIHRMELRYEVLRKKQEDYIKEMEQCVFKRETIQLKYLPKVEKKNAEDKSSQGKLSRQIANLKQTLKHTTENTMQLDTTIESRRNEIQKISNEINNERDRNEAMKQQMHEMQIDLLTKKLEKAKLVFAQEKNKTLSQRYDEVATSKLFGADFLQTVSSLKWMSSRRTRCWRASATATSLLPTS